MPHDPSLPARTRSARRRRGRRPAAPGTSGGRSQSRSTSRWSRRSTRSRSRGSRFPAGTTIVQLINFGMDNHDLIIQRNTKGSKPIAFKLIGAERTRHEDAPASRRPLHPLVLGRRATASKAWSRRSQSGSRLSRLRDRRQPSLDCLCVPADDCSGAVSGGSRHGFSAPGGGVLGGLWLGWRQHERSRVPGGHGCFERPEGARRVTG